MFFRQFILALVLCSSLASSLIATTERGDRLIVETGGVQGIAGVAGPAGAPGLAGAAGSQGIPGIPGAPGILSFGDFYALQGGMSMYTDNPGGGIAAGAAVNFPRDGSISATGITPLTTSSFNLATIGTYLVLFQVDVASAAQLMLRLNLAPIPDSVVGRATGSSQITGLSVISTTISNSVLEVINPPSNSTVVVIPANDGGTQAISAHLVIIRIL
jgi:hypothetical protein